MGAAGAPGDRSCRRCNAKCDQFALDPGETKAGKFTRATESTGIRTLTRQASPGIKCRRDVMENEDLKSRLQALDPTTSGVEIKSVDEESSRKMLETIMSQSVE